MKLKELLELLLSTYKIYSRDSVLIYHHGYNDLKTLGTLLDKSIMSIACDESSTVIIRIDILQQDITGV